MTCSQSNRHISCSYAIKYQLLNADQSGKFLLSLERKIEFNIMWPENYILIVFKKRIPLIYGQFES